jgi:predicted GTPase
MSGSRNNKLLMSLRKSTDAAAAPPLSINDKINQEMKRIDERYDNRNEIHSLIHADVNFTLNSLNLLVGETGAGKSRAVFREVGKLKHVTGK